MVAWDLFLDIFMPVRVVAPDDRELWWIGAALGMRRVIDCVVLLIEGVTCGDLVALKCIAAFDNS